MSRIQVLLSTYQGAAFLEALLASVFAQDHPDVAVLARDDGSVDGTRERLAAHARAGRLALVAGENLGAAASFFELLSRADDRAAYFAFCDQDDVWLPDKLRRAAQFLERQPAATPALYCGRQILVDASLDRLGLSRVPRRGPAFPNALVENIATGCTVVLNAAARLLLVRERPRSTVMHDWWAYLVVTALGQVLYDGEPHVLYRQHAGNVIGTAHGARERWERRVDRWRRHRSRSVLLDQALELRRLYGAELDRPRRLILERFIDRRKTWRAGLRYAAAPGVFRQALFDDLVLRALIALRRV